MRETNRREQTRMLSTASIALALSVVSLFLFRGVTSILSTFMIPAIIVLFSKKDDLTVFAYTAFGLITVTVLFFQTQIIFVTGYLFLSLALKHYFMESEMKLKISLSGVVKYLLIVVAVLFVGIQLTQIIFLIPLHDMMLRMSNADPLRYLGILLLEGVAITLFNLLILKAFTSRIKLS